MLSIIRTNCYYYEEYLIFATPKFKGAEVFDTGIVGRYSRTEPFVWFRNFASRYNYYIKEGKKS